MSDCPTCGGPVKVVGKTTLHYEPSCACRGRKPLFKLSGIDLVYSPDDERHWLKLGLLLERGSEDINGCDLLIMPKGTIPWEETG